jgi:pantetheine-phosphate adenylyltransferase
MTKAFLVGSFYPFTDGHLDVLLSTLGVFSKVIVGVGISPTKKGLFDFEERAALINEAVAALDPEFSNRIEVVFHQGLAIEGARSCGANVIVKGLRDASDLDDEMKQAGMNGDMAPEIQTIFIPASPEYRHINATLVRQIFNMGGDVEAFVPENVHQALMERRNPA